MFIGFFLARFRWKSQGSLYKTVVSIVVRELAHEPDMFQIGLWGEVLSSVEYPSRSCRSKEGNTVKAKSQRVIARNVLGARDLHF